MSEEKNWAAKINETGETIEKISRGEIEFFRSGFQDIDRVIYGSILPGSHIIVAGATGMGKTMVMLNMLLRLAHAEKRVRFFSLELSCHNLVVRLIANLTEIPAMAIKKGDLSEDQFDKVRKAQAHLKNLDMDIYDNIFDPEKVCKKIEDEDPDIFFIDYLQIMDLEKGVKGINRTQEVGKISKMIRQTARKSNSISIVGSQINRNVRNRDDKRPNLSDLRDSGEIEQDGDLVAILYRDEYYHPDTTAKPGTLEVLLAKNREGPTGNTELLWNPKISRVEDFSGSSGSSPEFVSFLDENIAEQMGIDEDVPF